MVLSLLACAPRLPTATLDGVSLTDVGWTEASAEVRVAVDNPLWAELPVTALRWSFDVEGRTVASGALDELDPIGADAVTVVPIPVVVRYADAVAATGAEGDVPWRFAAEVDLDTRFGALTLPIERAGTMPRPEAPSLDLVDVGFGLDGTAVLVDVGLDLGLPAGTSLDTFRWNAAVDRYTIGAGSARIREGHVRLPMRVDLASAASAALDTLLGRTSALTVGLDGELATPLGVVPIGWSRDVRLDD